MFDLYFKTVAHNLVILRHYLLPCGIKTFFEYFG